MKLKKNFFTGIFQGFNLDFKNLFFPEPLWVAASGNICIKSDTGVFHKASMWAEWNY